LTFPPADSEILFDKASVPSENQKPRFKKSFIRGPCKTLESKRKSSFRASEARPGIQDFQAILDYGFQHRRNDEVTDFCKRLIRFRKKIPEKDPLLV
jgi:hypothetical protein